MEGYGEGQRRGDWTSDTVPHPGEYECTECHDKIAPDVWFFQQDERLLCGDCIVMVLNAREDHIRELEANKALCDTWRPVVAMQSGG